MSDFTPIESIRPKHHSRKSAEIYEQQQGSDVKFAMSSHHHHHFNLEWEAKEELRCRELEEAKARAAQMEKTMRWWSDCTANWREKWGKVRTERNKAREESRLLRGKLEASLKDINGLKRDKQELEIKLERVKDLELVKCSCKKVERDRHSLKSEIDENIPERDILPEKLNQLSLQATDIDPDIMESVTRIIDSASNRSSSDLDFLDKLLNPGKDNKDYSSGSTSSCESPEKSVSHRKTLDIEEHLSQYEIAEQKTAMLQLRLDEASKTILAERHEKNKLVRSMEKLQFDLSQLQIRYEDLRRSRQDTVKELTITKAEHQDELENIRLDLEDEANSRTSLDHRLSDLRAELEKLQAENATEWGKRERLETEKLALERENKKLQKQIEDLEERLERKSQQINAANNCDIKSLQDELHDRNKELSDLKHAHGKLKKVLQDKSTELAHAMRRSEQYESEVRKLRCRTEELKKELASAEDEVDSGTNQIRKLQRTTDELQEQVENMQVQIEHLQSRLREHNISPVDMAEEF